MSQGRKSGKEFFKFNDYSGDLGLLQHDLRDQNVVRGGIISPGEETFMLRIPRKDSRGK